MRERTGTTQGTKVCVVWIVVWANVRGFPPSDLYDADAEDELELGVLRLRMDSK